jgi:hypothetical protein
MPDCENGILVVMGERVVPGRLKPGLRTKGLRTFSCIICWQWVG